MAKYTADDVRRVANAIRQAKGTDRPYVFLVGAGISVTANVPLASQLIAQIRRDYGPQVDLMPEADRTNYGKVMGQLTPQERRDVLQPVMENAKVNWANIAIASMLKAGFIEKCLTLNFDNVLERACGLVGYYPAVYDFGLSPSSEVGHIVSGSVIHLHGQSYGLVMLNSDEETERHAEAVTPLFQSVLGNRGMVVIGYSGDADSIFPVLKNHHDGHDRLYWVGHGDGCAPHVHGLVSRPRCYAEYLGGADADIFLVKLATELGCWPPTVLHRPYQHLREEIQDVVDYPSELAQFGNLVGQLREHLDAWESWRKPKEAVAELETLMLKRDFEQVLLKADKKIPEQAELAAWALVEQGNELTDRKKADWSETKFLAGLEQYKAALALEPNMHQALYNWGIALANLSEIRSDPMLLDQACSKYAEAQAIKPNKHEALGNWGNALAELAQVRRDPTLLDEACSKYAEVLAIKPDEQLALRNWGATLCQKFHFTGDTAVLQDARTKSEQLEAITNRPNYNLACALALLGEEDACREKLGACRDAGTLPAKSHLLADDDLAAYRDRDWFKIFVESLPDK